MISNTIEHNRGADASLLVSGTADPLSFLASSFSDVDKTYRQLRTKEARRAFFEAGMTRLDRNLPGSWARLYWFIDLCRREQWFWEEKGYESFEDFWAKQGKFAFAEIAKLETMFHFAKTACPNLFELSQKDAEQLWDSLSQLSAKAANRTARVSKKAAGRNAFLFPELDYDTQSQEFQRGYQASCGMGAIRRFRRLKKEHPAIAKEVLEGKFVKKIKGKLRPDLAAAEKKAGIYVPRRRVPKSEQVADRLAGLTSKDLEAVWKALDGTTKRRLRAFL